MEMCYKDFNSSHSLRIKDCIEKNTLSKREVIKNILLGFDKKELLMEPEGFFVDEGFLNMDGRAQFFTVNLETHITPDYDNHQIYFELPFSMNFEILIHDRKFFTMSYIPTAMPFLFKALLMNETSNHYYQMVMTEMEELDLAQDPCVGDEQYDFKVSHVFRQSEREQILIKQRCHVKWRPYNHLFFGPFFKIIHRSGVCQSEYNAADIMQNKMGASVRPKHAPLHHN